MLVQPAIIALQKRILITCVYSEALLSHIKIKDKRDLQNFHLVADFGIDVALVFRTVKIPNRRGGQSITPVKAEEESLPDVRTWGAVVTERICPPRFFRREKGYKF